jgi:hypothetical protein
VKRRYSRPQTAKTKVVPLPLGSAIANLNTLIYVVINLRALQRIRQHQPEATTLHNN